MCTSSIIHCFPHCSLPFILDAPFPNCSNKQKVAIQTIEYGMFRSDVHPPSVSESLAQELANLPPAEKVFGLDLVILVKPIQKKNICDNFSSGRNSTPICEVKLDAESNNKNFPYRV